MIYSLLEMEKFLFHGDILGLSTISTISLKENLGGQAKISHIEMEIGPCLPNLEPFLV
jgi:hypothetical protein